MPNILLLVGTPGSGKTHFSEYWCKKFPSYKRISQDDLGSRIECEIKTIKCLKQGYSVIIDRCNFNKSQRSVWINIARELDIDINCIYLDVPIEVCKERILQRKNHPTEVEGEGGIEILENFMSQFRIPNRREGFGIVIYLKHYQLENRYTVKNASISDRTIQLVVNLLNRNLKSNESTDLLNFSSIHEAISDIIDSKDNSTSQA